MTHPYGRLRPPGLGLPAGGRGAYGAWTGAVARDGGEPHATGTQAKKTMRASGSPSRTLT